jgi:hypothetical protein
LLDSKPVQDVTPMTLLVLTEVLPIVSIAVPLELSTPVTVPEMVV